MGHPRHHVNFLVRRYRGFRKPGMGRHALPWAAAVATFAVQALMSAVETRRISAFETVQMSVVATERCVLLKQERSSAGSTGQKSAGEAKHMSTVVTRLHATDPPCPKHQTSGLSQQQTSVLSQQPTSVLSQQRSPLLIREQTYVSFPNTKHTLLKSQVWQCHNVHIPCRESGRPNVINNGPKGVEKGRQISRIHPKEWRGHSQASGTCPAA